MHSWKVEKRDQQYLEERARVAVEAANCEEEDGWRARRPTGKPRRGAGHVQARDSWQSVDETREEGDGKKSREKGEHQERGQGKEVGTSEVVYEMMLQLSVQQNPERLFDGWSRSVSPVSRASLGVFAEAGAIAVNAL